MTEAYIVQYALATLCIGVGQAVGFEAVNDDGQVVLSRGLAEVAESA